MASDNKRFTFFENWGELGDELTDEELGQLVRGMYEYAFKGQMPEFNRGSVVWAIWTAIYPNIKSSVDGVENGKKGGRPKKTETPDETEGKNTSQKPSRKTPKKNPTEKHQDRFSQERKGREGNENFSLEKNSHSPVAPGGADAQGAPPAAPVCPTCGVDMKRTNMRVPGTDRRYWRCPLCAEEVSE